MIRVGLATSQVFHGRAGEPASHDHASGYRDTIWLLGWSENPCHQSGTLASLPFMQECIQAAVISHCPGTLGSAQEDALRLRRAIRADGSSAAVAPTRSEPHLKRANGQRESGKL